MSVCVFVSVTVTVSLCVYWAPFPSSPLPFVSLAVACFLFLGQPDKDLTRYCKTAAATVTPPSGPPLFLTPFSLYGICMHTHIISLSVRLSVLQPWPAFRKYVAQIVCCENLIKKYLP